MLTQASTRRVNPTAVHVNLTARHTLLQARRQEGQKIGARAPQEVWVVVVHRIIVVEHRYPQRVLAQRLNKYSKSLVKLRIERVVAPAFKPQLSEHRQRNQGRAYTRVVPTRSPFQNTSQ